MLMLRSADVFLLMGAAMMVAGAGAHALRAAGVRSLIGGTAITWEGKPPTRDHIVGSVTFGLGWSVAGSCPGPIAAQVGQGQLTALATVAGLLVGVGLRGWQQRGAVAQVVS